MPESPYQAAARSKLQSGRCRSDAELLQEIRDVRREHTGGGRATRGIGASTSEVDLTRDKPRGYMPQATPNVRRRAPPMTNEQMREHVFQAAMSRYVEDLKDEVAKSHADKVFTAESISRSKVEELEAVSKRRDLELRNQQQVLNQIEENKHIRARRRAEHVEAASAHGAPLFTETFISQPEVNAYMKDRKQKMREDLDNQRQMTSMLRNLVVKRDKEWASQVLQDNLRSMVDDRRTEREKKLYLRDEMRRNWDRDINLRNVRRTLVDAARRGAALEDVNLDTMAAPPADVLTLP